MGSVWIKANPRLPSSHGERAEGARRKFTLGDIPQGHCWTPTLSSTVLGHKEASGADSEWKLCSCVLLCPRRGLLPPHRFPLKMENGGLGLSSVHGQRSSCSNGRLTAWYMVAGLPTHPVCLGLSGLGTKSPCHRDYGSSASNLRMFSKQVSPSAVQPPQKQTPATTGCPCGDSVSTSRATLVSRFPDTGSRDSAGVSSCRSRWEIVQVGGASEQV